MAKPCSGCPLLVIIWLGSSARTSPGMQTTHVSKTPIARTTENRELIACVILDIWPSLYESRTFPGCSPWPAFTLDMTLPNQKSYISPARKGVLVNWQARRGRYRFADLYCAEKIMKTRWLFDSVPGGGALAEQQLRNSLSGLFHINAHLGVGR